MAWDMLNESKKLFPHWLDKSDDSNFTKHLKVLNHQQMDKRHKLKCIDWSRLLNKPLQIHKVQNEPYKWKVEFEATVPRLKKVNIYKNPTIYNNKVINNYEVINGYYYNDEFYENQNIEVSDLLNDSIDEMEKTYSPSEYERIKSYSNLIEGIDDKYYYDILSKKYYLFKNGEYTETSIDNVPQTSLIHSESFIDNYTKHFRHILYEDNSNHVIIQQYIPIEDDTQKYKTDFNGNFELQLINSNTPLLYYNLTNNTYCVLNNTDYIEIENNKIIHLDCEITTKTISDENITFYDYYYLNNNNEKVYVNLNDNSDENYYIFTEYSDDIITSKIPFIIIKDNKTIVLEEDDKKYKIRLNHHEKYVDNNEQKINIVDNGKFELSVKELYYNITDESYYYNDENNNQFIKIDNEKIIYLNYSNNNYYYINKNDEVINVDLNTVDDNYYITTHSESNIPTFRIPLIETIDNTPIISNDKYVLEVYTWDDYHFLKGFPEIDFIDYNNNNIIDIDERNYDNLNIELEKIGNNEYLTFRVHQFGIKSINILKDGKLLHEVDFNIENADRINSNFAYIYNYNDNQLYYPHTDNDKLKKVNMDIDEYVWRLPITEEDKIYDEKHENFELKNKYDLQVVYYSNPSDPFNTEYDKILKKTYVCEDSIFYHDVSLDMIGTLYNVPRHVFRQPYLETYEDKIKFYQNTYPKYCNSLNEDDYHYQKRLEYYINNYNKIYFPCLELWKYFHIDSELVNRKVIVAEQNYSYLRTLSAEEDDIINELSVNKLDSDYSSDNEVVTLNKPVLKSRINQYDYEHNRNGILINEDDEYIYDIYGTPVRIDYDYKINSNDEYVIKYNTFSKKIYWYNANKIDYSNESIYQIILTDSIKIVPNTKYQLRFCVKEYPSKELKLKLIYKDNNNNVRNVEEYTPIRKDYDNTNENNELIYTNYKTEWEVDCEYICTNFITSDIGQNIEIILESESNYKISDVTLQRITINHFDSEYMKTSNDYNSCVYDLYADYNEIPSNIRYEKLSIFKDILNRSLPLTRKGYFNFAIKNTDLNNDLELKDITNIYINNMLDVGSSMLPITDYATADTAHDNIYTHTYKFNKYVQEGEYEIQLKPYYSDENNIIFDLNIEITMLVFTEDNHAVYDKLIIDNIINFYVEDEKCFKIPFKNKSNTSFDIKLYRNSSFAFKNFKLIRKFPLTMEEITK